MYFFNMFKFIKIFFWYLFLVIYIYGVIVIIFLDVVLGIKMWNYGRLNKGFEYREIEILFLFFGVFIW